MEDFTLNERGEMILKPEVKNQLRNHSPSQPQHFTFSDAHTSTMTQPFNQINLNNPQILSNPPQITRNLSSQSTLPLSPQVLSTPPPQIVDVVGNYQQSPQIQNQPSPDCWDAGNNFNNFGRGYGQPGLDGAGPSQVVQGVARLGGQGVGPESNRTDLATNEMPRGMEQQMRDPRVQMAMERMQDNKQAQLDMIKKEEEIQALLQRERMEAEIRQQLQAQAQAQANPQPQQQNLGARPRYHSIQDQKSRIQNYTQEDVRKRAGSYQDQFLNYQQRNNGM